MARKLAAAAPAPEVVYLPCSMQDCRIGARFKIKTSTGWANFCEQHYEQWHMRGVHVRLQAQGLDRKPDEAREAWLERMRVWRLAKMSQFGKAKPPEYWDAKAKQIIADADSGKPISMFVLERFKAYAERRKSEQPMREPGEDSAEDIGEAA